MHRTRIFVLILPLLAALLLVGCSSKPTPSEKDSGSSAEATGASLEEFLKADTKHGTGTTSNTFGDQQSVFDTEFWVDGRRFRYDLKQEGKLVRSIMSPDGKSAYIVHHEREESELSVASVDRYLLEFTEPSQKSSEDGVDEATNALRLKYTVQKTESIKGADNAWYTEDVTYLVADGRVIGVITRGGVPGEDGKVADLSEARRLFKTLSVGEKIDSKVFKLPFPVLD